MCVLVCVCVSGLYVQAHYFKHVCMCVYYVCYQHSRYGYWMALMSPLLFQRMWKSRSQHTGMRTALTGSRSGHTHTSASPTYTCARACVCSKSKEDMSRCCAWTRSHVDSENLYVSEKKTVRTLRKRQSPAERERKKT